MSKAVVLLSFLLNLNRCLFIGSTSFIVCTPPPFYLGEGGWTSYQKGGGGLDKTSILEGVV